ncbi:hypothetical protein [Streptomyces sp. NPDC048269]|uniref:hypothetical protein n=1 Tax=Streptomyces sp. NPDC048269 TaxID=3155753 RepID=UPI00343ECD2E
MAAGLPDGVRQCRFDRDGTEPAVVWAPAGTGRLPAPRHVTGVRHLDDTTSPVGADGMVGVTALPAPTP